MPYDARSGFSTLQVEHAVDVHLHVVARDADLLRDVDRDFLQRVAVADRRRRTARGCGSRRRAWRDSVPSRSTTYALCCGTTTAVRDRTNTTSTARAKTTISAPESMTFLPDPTRPAATASGRRPASPCHVGRCAAAAGRRCVRSTPCRAARALPIPPGGMSSSSTAIWPTSRVHPVGRVFSRAEPAHQPAARGHQADERDQREQQPLQRRRLDHPDRRRAGRR